MSHEERDAGHLWAKFKKHWPIGTWEPNYFDAIAELRGWNPLVEGESMGICIGNKQYSVKRLKDNEYEATYSEQVSSKPPVTSIEEAKELLKRGYIPIRHSWSSWGHTVPLGMPNMWDAMFRVNYGPVPNDMPRLPCLECNGWGCEECWDTGIQLTEGERRREEAFHQPPGSPPTGVAEAMCASIDIMMANQHLTTMRSKLDQLEKVLNEMKELL